MAGALELEWFDSAAEVETFVWGELIATLREDLERMENEERTRHTEEDRRDMRKKIEDSNYRHSIYTIKCG